MSAGTVVALWVVASVPAALLLAIAMRRTTGLDLPEQVERYLRAVAAPHTRRRDAALLAFAAVAVIATLVGAVVTVPGAPSASRAKVVAAPSSPRSAPPSDLSGREVAAPPLVSAPPAPAPEPITPAATPTLVAAPAVISVAPSHVAVPVPPPPLPVPTVVVPEAPPSPPPAVVQTGTNKPHRRHDPVRRARSRVSATVQAKVERLTSGDHPVF